MAVLALGFAGQALGGMVGGSILGVSSGVIGGMIGSTIGGLVDNLLFPQKAQGPRLDDLTVTVSTYGKPLPLIYGPENRIAGNVIWSTGLIETKKKTKHGGKGGPSVQMTEYSYRASLAVALGEGALSGIRKIWANNKLIWERGEAPPEDVPPGLYGAIRFYPGNFTQNPDPTIEAVVGVGQTPAYRGTAYVVFEDLQLADFGNRLPNLEFLVEGQERVTASFIARDVLRRCGVDLNLASTISLDDVVRGLAIGTASSGAGALQPLALAFDFDVAEVGGALRMTKRDAGPAGVIRVDQLAGHEGRQERPADTLRWERAQVTGLPREAVVTHADPDRDYQPSAQRAVRSQGSADSNLANEIPVVLEAGEARRLADRMLWEAWTGAQTAEAQTDDRWVALEPGRTYYVQTIAGLERIRLTRMTRGWNGVIDMSLRRDRDEVYRGSTDGVVAPTPPNELIVAGAVRPFFLDIPILIDEDDATAEGFYYGAAVVEGAGEWRGADLWRALEQEGDYESVGTAPGELEVGFTSLGVAAPPPGFDVDEDWDDETEIYVKFWRLEEVQLESLPDAEVLAGRNAVYLAGPQGSGMERGGEIIQYGAAELQGDGETWKLTHLRRGQKGTEAEARTVRGPLSSVILLNPATLRRASFGYGDVGQARWFKATSPLVAPALAPAFGFTNTGVGMRPYAPIDLEASGSGDLDLSWTRRSRVGWPALQPPPLAEEQEVYRLQIMDGATVKRTELLYSPAFTYTTAMQTADFGGPVTSLAWRVAQVSATFGSGSFAESSGSV